MIKIYLLVVCIGSHCTGLCGEAGKLSQRMMVGPGEAESDEELFPEVVTHQAVHQEVDAGVQDRREVGHVGQTLDPPVRVELHLLLVAGDDGLQVVELPDVNDGPGGAAADEDDDDAEENHEHVHLLPQLPL